MGLNVNVYIQSPYRRCSASDLQRDGRIPPVLHEDRVDVKDKMWQDITDKITG
jgi:murein endopeptidase